MTTPNIKALAEQIKKNYEAQPDWAEHKIENVSYQLASALLRVMEDADRLKVGVLVYHSPKRKCGCVQCQNVESHNKLMEELGGE